MSLPDTSNISTWLTAILQSGIAAAIAIAVLVLFRDSIGKHFAARINLRASAELEEVKAKLKAIEMRHTAEQQELIEQRAFFRRELATSRRERNAALQEKKVEVAEELVATFEHLNGMGVCIEMLKIIKYEELIADAGLDETAKLFALLSKSAAVDEWLNRHKDRARGKFRRDVFLPEEVVQNVEAYEMVVVYAVTLINFMANSIDPRDFFSFGSIRGKILQVLPEAQKGFDEFGDKWAFYCADLCLERAMKALRSSLWGAESDVAMQRDVEYVLQASATADTHRMYSTLSGLGFPTEHLRASGQTDDRD
ncbi:hypothetical protein [Palleronia sp. LCG004]|uniref:hypothetical protein n=1 Tax=Palleronia sp. LCG004 TaxID=3079304 RepID=UPI002942A770|nr:hypothetical protein [Palleronia sp. LCG004]WOI55588.1 hypothetical protein RVY76_11120 [Palleronia sp. LCG004]